MALHRGPRGHGGRRQSVARVSIRDKSHLPADVGSLLSGRTQEGFQGPVSADSDFQLHYRHTGPPLVHQIIPRGTEIPTPLLRNKFAANKSEPAESRASSKYFI